MLMNNFLDQIKNNESVRQNLINLKNAIKDDNQKKALAYELAGDFSVFTELLSHSDPKVRKNAVLILGEMECEDLIVDIWNAYQKEDTLFVKADYLKSLQHYQCKQLLPQFQVRMEELTNQQISTEEDKHVGAEIGALQKLIHQYEKKKIHHFTGYEDSQNVILLTNRNHRDVTAMSCQEEVKYLAGGLRLRTENLKDILNIRTYSELLFPIPGITTLEGGHQELASALTGKLLAFLSKNHSGKAPFYFRVEIKGITDRDKKTSMIKKFSASLEKESNRALLNSTSEYEIEIRLIANKKGQYVPLLKLFTIPDTRFDYRKEVLPTSIAPVNAALMMQLAKEYLKEDAQVLDPFCGTGTMLIERCRLSRCNSVYGLDILEEAVEKARFNTELSHLPIHYINRDYFDFRHDYLFDEIITNMPAPGKTRTREDIMYLYRRFLDKSREVLKKSAILLIYTTVPEILQDSLKVHHEYQVLNEFIMNEREGSICYIIKYRG